MTSTLTIATWRERIGATNDFPLHAPTDVERTMVAEIAELRGMLERHNVTKAIYWFDTLAKCGRLLDVPSTEPIPSGVLRAVEQMTVRTQQEGA